MRRFRIGGILGKGTFVPILFVCRDGKRGKNVLNELSLTKEGEFHVLMCVDNFIEFSME